MFIFNFRNSPHAPMGYNSSKQVKREIERRIDQIDKLYFEPRLYGDDGDKFILGKLPPYYYRMKAVDDVKLLEKEIPISRGSSHLRSFLLNYLNGSSSTKCVHQFGTLHFYL